MNNTARRWYGISAFIRDGDNVYRTYFINDASRASGYHRIGASCTP